MKANQTMTETPPETPHAPKPQVGFDWRDWLPYLAETDLSEREKQAMIEALWSIILGFIDLGVEVKAPADCCGEAIDLGAALAATMVNSDDDQEDAA